MTDLLKQALEALGKLPPREQDAYARALLETLPDEDVYELDEGERRSLAASKSEAAQRDFVSDAEVEAFWRNVGV